MDFWTQCPEVENISDRGYDTAVGQGTAFLRTGGNRKRISLPKCGGWHFRALLEV